MQGRDRSVVPEPIGDAPAGDDEAFARALHRELRLLAASHLRRERPGHTLQPTALAHEAWLRLEERGLLRSGDRAAVFGVAAQAIRRALVDHARRHGAQKRGGRLTRVAVDLDRLPGGDAAVDLLELDQALEALRALDDRQAQTVELRFFGGLSVPECARALRVSEATVKRDWELARAFLYRELDRD